MNKKLIEECVYSEDGITYMSDKQYNNYIDIIEEYRKIKHNLEQQNKKLKEIIDKAIEYTRNTNLPDWFVTKDQYDEAFAYEMLHIREILKGDNNE